MSSLVIAGGGRLQGDATVPGDKSISHRALLFAALADGESRLWNLLPGGDCGATLGCVRALGVEVEEEGGEVRVRGEGLSGLREPAGFLDCENSGTTMRLLVGLLAGQGFTSFLTGTAQLRGRPMGRVVEPLRRMGAHILGREAGGRAPLAIEGRPLGGIDYTLPVASAQVKSCLLLAGLFAGGETRVTEPAPTRDHTELLLLSMGASLTVRGATVEARRPGRPLAPLELTVPGDISSAAFPLVAAACLPGSAVRLREVGVNPRRAGVLAVLARMGAELGREAETMRGGEPVADLVVRGGSLRSCEIGGAEIPSLIDELPVLAVAASQAEGCTRVRDAAELRVKETDRIATTVAELRALGAAIEATPDGFVVEGPCRLRGARVASHGDHRLAMALAVAGLCAEGETVVDGAAVTADSFPGFVATLRGLGAALREER